MITQIIWPFNAWLYVRKLVNTKHYQYVYCTNNNLDDIIHYLVTCPPVSRYWESFVTWWNSLKYSKLNPLPEDNTIMRFPVETNQDIVLNYCLFLY